MVKFAGIGGWPESSYLADWNNFGPRFGFAWKPGSSERWVIRGGYGIFYEGPSTFANMASLGFELSAAAASPDDGVTPAFLLRDGPDVKPGKPELNDAFGAVPVGKTPDTDVYFYELGRRTGYAQHFNIGVQRQLPRQTVVEISYVANLSRKLPSASRNINQVPSELMGPGECSSAPAISPVRRRVASFLLRLGATTSIPAPYESRSAFRTVSACFRDTPGHEPSEM